MDTATDFAKLVIKEKTLNGGGGGLVFVTNVVETLYFFFFPNFRGFCFLWTVLCFTWFLGLTQGNSEGKLHLFFLSPLSTKVKAKCFGISLGPSFNNV